MVNIPLRTLAIVGYVVMASLHVDVLAYDDPAAPKLDTPNDGKTLFTEEQFEVATGISPNGLGATKELIEQGVEREIQHLEKFCELSKEQLAKLRFSKRGQFQRWLDDAERARQKYAGQRLDRDELTRAAVELGFLRRRVTTFPLNPDCIFQKVLQKTLTDEQRPGFAKYYETRQRERLDRAWAHWEVVGRDKRMILSVQTREKVADVLLANASPLAKNGEYGYIVVLLQMDQLRERLKPLMSDMEWRGFESSLAAAKEFEPRLREYDLWPIRDSTK